MDDALKYSLSKIHMEELQLSVRMHNALRRAGLNSILDVCRMIDDGGIWHIRNMGTKSVEEVLHLTEQYLETFGTSIDQIARFDPAKEEASAAFKANKEEYPDIQIVSDIPITFFTDFLGAKLVEDLHSIAITKIADLDNLVNRYLNYILPGSQLIDKSIEVLVQQIRQLIAKGSLSPNVPVESTTLSNLLNVRRLEIDDKITQLDLLKRILAGNSLTHEINNLMFCLTNRQKEIFLDYSLNDLTLEAIGTKLTETVTRERIRQVLSQATTKLRKQLDTSLNVYIATSFEVANELGTSLSKEAWKSQLIDRRILIDSDQDYQSFDIFCALIKNKNTFQSIPGIPENVQWVVKNKQEFPIYVLRALSGNINKELKEIKRIIKFTGGIAQQQAEQILGFNGEQTSGILKGSGINEVSPGWYSMVADKELTKNTPIFRAGLIMMQSCGPLPFESFLDGLRRYVSRHYEAMAPTEVIKSIIKNFGFKIENNIVSYEGKEKIILSTSESLLINLLTEKGPVLNFQEIVEFYLSNGKSFATATTKIMPDSPIIEKIEQGLYKLRGSIVSWQDIEKAKSRQEEYSRNAEVTYGLDGIIRYRITIGSWEAGGTLSISRSCQPLPDFSQGWPVYVNKIESGIARRDDYLIWGLTPAFSLLGVKFGDRIELAFDTWKEPKITISIVEEKNV